MLGNGNGDGDGGGAGVGVTELVRSVQLQPVRRFVYRHLDTLQCASSDELTTQSFWAFPLNFVQIDGQDCEWPFANLASR